MNWPMHEPRFLPFICQLEERLEKSLKLEKSSYQQKSVSVRPLLLPTHQHFMCDVQCQLACDNSIVSAQMSPLMSPRSRLMSSMMSVDVADVEVDVAWISVDVVDVEHDVVGRSIKLVISPRLLWEATSSRLRDMEGKQELVHKKST